MPWKQIKGRSYFYRSRREGGRVVHDYLGRSPEAESIAGLLEEERLKRRRARRKLEEDRRPYQDLDLALERVSEASQGALRGVLSAAGFHQHHRGEWRRRRERQ